MVRAYVLIEMMAGQSMKLVQALRANHSVEAVDRVTGPYDVIAIIAAENVNEVSNVVNDDVHTLGGIIRTTTCVVLE